MTETKTQTQESPTKSKKNITDTQVPPAQLNLCGMKLDTDEVVEKLQKLRVSCVFFFFSKMSRICVLKAVRPC